MSAERSSEEGKVPVRPRRRNARKVSRPNRHNPLGKQLQKKEDLPAAEDNNLMALLAAALKNVLDVGGDGVAKQKDLEKDKEEIREKKQEKEERPVPQSLAKAVAKPLTSEPIPEEKEDTFWQQVRGICAEVELLHPLKFWGSVLFLVACFVTLLILGAVALFQWQTEEEQVVKREEVVEEERAVAPLEVSVAAINKMLKAGGENEGRKMLIGSEPAAPAARYLLAISDYRMGNSLQARSALELAPVKGNTSRSSEQAFLAWTAIIGKPSEFLLPQAANDDKVLEHIRSALGSDPTNIFAWRLLALWQRRNGQEEEAVATLEAARLPADASGQRLEVEMQLAVARIGAVGSAAEAKAIAQPRTLAVQSAMQAAIEARWGTREKAVEELQRLTGMVGLPSTISLLQDPLFVALSMTQEEAVALRKEGGRQAP